jgi:hypothetical protein
MEQPARKRRLFRFAPLISPHMGISIAVLHAFCAGCGLIQN